MTRLALIVGAVLTIACKNSKPPILAQPADCLLWGVTPARLDATLTLGAKEWSQNDHMDSLVLIISDTTISGVVDFEYGYRRLILDDTTEIPPLRYAAFARLSLDSAQRSVRGYEFPIRLSLLERSAQLSPESRVLSIVATLRDRAGRTSCSDTLTIIPSI